MKTFALVVALLASGAARADWSEWNPPSTKEKVLLGATEALIVADCWTTADYLHRFRGSFETNPLLGRHPSNAKLFALCGAGALATAALWYALPSPWRSLATGSIAVIELGVVTDSVIMGARFRF